MNKIFIGVGAVVCLIIGLGIGYKLYSNPINLAQGVSTVGATNNTAKLATITMAPLTAGATTTSLFNGDGTDREVTSSVIACTSVGTSQTFTTGSGLASWTLQAATTSVSGLGLNGNTNYAANLTLATSSAWYYQASTTETVPIYVGRVWPTQTYLSFGFNATNTAACTVGVHYINL